MTSSPAALTNRERDVLALIARGYTNRAIAAELVLSNASIEKHSASLFRKLRLGSDPSRNPRVMAALHFHGVRGEPPARRRTDSPLHWPLVLQD